LKGTLDAMTTETTEATHAAEAKTDPAPPAPYVAPLRDRYLGLAPLVVAARAPKKRR
jgi:hypothetical protein